MPQRPRVIELVGPAGVGKTTLAQLLEAQGKAVRGTIWHVPAILLARGTLRQLPKAVALYRDTGALLWDELKHFARLEALYQFIHGPACNGYGLVVLDEGPVYTLSYLQVMGHGHFRNGTPDPWSRATLRHWAGTVDAVVVLDAPDAVLAARMRAREKPHLFKDRSDPELREFAAAYRAATDRVLADFARCGGPPVLTLHAGGEPTDRLSDPLLAAVEGALHGR